MDKIFAIVDAQGFIVKKKFYAREVAIINDNFSYCQEYDPNLHLDYISKDDVRRIKFCTYKLHGLTLRPMEKSSLTFMPKSDDIIGILRHYHKLLSHPNRPYFGVKNELLRRILEDGDIPYLDLNREEFNFPSINYLEKFYNNYWTCGYHRKFPVNINPNKKEPIISYRCAFRKCANIWRHIKARTNKIFDCDVIEGVVI